MKYQILNGDNIEILKTLPENSIDSIITDPPYGIAFLGKEWDHKRATETTSKIAQLHNLPSGMKHTTLADDLEFQYWLRERWIECLRVLKPGGHILAFSAARTYHHMAMSLQTAGFEIRDQIMWIYSSGFPKSQDVGRSIQRNLGVKKKKKNFTGRETTYDTFLKEAQGKTTESKSGGYDEVIVTDPEAKQWEGWGTALKPAHEPICMARKPMKLSIAKNAQKWGTGALNIDDCRVPYEDQKDIDTYLNNKRGPMERGNDVHGENIRMFNGETGFKAVKRTVTIEQDLPEQGRFPSNVIGEIADYQKYFYCPKINKKERGEFNNHPTVKPVELMEYLIKLVTPPGGTVLDPFNGSGSTGMAAVELGHEYIGIEQDANYCEISKKRIEAWLKIRDPLRASGLFT